MSKLIGPSLAEIKPVYYPGEEKLVSLEVLKLYCGEEVVRQNPDDIDPNKWCNVLLHRGVVTKITVNVYTKSLYIY